MIEERLECLRLAAGLYPEATPDDLIQTANLFLHFIEGSSDLHGKKTSKQNRNTPRQDTQANPVRLDPPDDIRDAKIRELVAKLPADDRIVMRAILERAQTEDLEQTFEEYRHKL